MARIKSIILLCMTDFEINQSNITSFAFTLRKTKLPVSKDDYVDRLHKIEKLGLSISDYVYEDEGGLHVHGVIEIPKDFNTVRLRMRGWRIQLDELYDMVGWITYMTKTNCLELKDNPEEEISEDERYYVKEAIIDIPKYKLF